MPFIRKKALLTSEERKKLSVLISEAQSRGLPVDELVKKLSEGQPREWMTDENGWFVRQDGKKFKPYPEQERFVRSASRFSLMVSGRGGGKSASGAQKALQKIKKGESGAVLNPTFENFKNSTWKEFREWIPIQYVIPPHRYMLSPEWSPQRPFRLAFENGSIVDCRGLKDAASARGPNINWLWYDEAQDDEDGMGWKIAVASVRVGENPQAWATATGRGTYHWMYEYFVEQEFPEDVWKMLREIQEEQGTSDIPFISYYEGTIEDNKANLDPMFYAAMLATYPTGYLREQELHGKFVDPGGNLGDPRWFDGHILDAPPDIVKRRVRYYDLAASEKKIAKHNKLTDPDETVGTLFSWWEEEKYVIENQVSGTWKWVDIKGKIKETAMLDGPFVPIYIEQEPGSGGINQVAEIKLWLREELPEWTVYEHKPEGDKIVRANIWFAEATQSKFYMVRGAWNDGFFKQLSSFPSGKHDDKIDSVSGARITCAPIRKWTSMKFLHLGTNFDKPEEIEENAVV